MTNARIKNNKLLTIRYDLRHRRASYGNESAFYIEIMNYLIPRNRFSKVFIYYTCYHHQLKSFVMCWEDRSITNHIRRAMLYFTVYKTRTTANVRPPNMPNFKLVQRFDQEDRTILQYKRRRRQWDLRCFIPQSANSQVGLCIHTRQSLQLSLSLSKSKR